MQDKPHVIIKPTKVKPPTTPRRALFGGRKKDGASDASGIGGK
jgi:hypothetical protein